MTDETPHGYAPRLRNMLDHGPMPPLRDPDHELIPPAPPRTLTGGEQMAETLIGHSDTATNLVLDALDRWEAKIGEIREIVLKSKIHAHDAIRAHMLISDTAMRGCDQIGQQVVDAVKMLATLNGKE
jgi:hypothetical protein